MASPVPPLQLQVLSSPAERSEGKGIQLSRAWPLDPLPSDLRSSPGMTGCGCKRGLPASSTPSELVAAHAPLDEEKIDHHAGEDDQEHHRGDRRAHGLVAELELEAEEGPVEERAEDVGREVRPGERPLRRVDQVEGVE